MRWLGYKQVKYSSISMDVADVRKRSKAAHVAELAQNVRDTADELIHAPTVRMPGTILVAGRDRMAALLILKTKKLWVRVVECTDAEAAHLKAWENVHRRTVDRNAELADAVRTTEAAIVEREGGTAVPGGKARQPNDIKAEARKAVAAAAGIKPASVKKAEQRAAKVQAGDSSSSANPPSPDESPALPPPPIDLLGTPRLKGNASYDLEADIQAQIDEADKHMRLAQAALKKLEGYGSVADLAQQLHAQVHRVASLVRSHRPFAICPWCKRLPTLMKDCNGCSRRGWVSQEVAMRAPKECITSSTTIASEDLPGPVTPPVVIWNGQTVAYADAVAGRWPKNGKAAKPDRGISVVLPDGSEPDLTVEYDEDGA